MAAFVHALKVGARRAPSAVIASRPAPPVKSRPMSTQSFNGPRPRTAPISSLLTATPARRMTTSSSPGGSSAGSSSTPAAAASTSSAAAGGAPNLQAASNQIAHLATLGIQVTPAAGTNLPPPIPTTPVFRFQEASNPIHYMPPGVQKKVSRTATGQEQAEQIAAALPQVEEHRQNVTASPAAMSAAIANHVHGSNSSYPPYNQSPFVSVTTNPFAAAATSDPWLKGITTGTGPDAEMVAPHIVASSPPASQVIAPEQVIGPQQAQLSIKEGENLYNGSDLASHATVAMPNFLGKKGSGGIPRLGSLSPAAVAALARMAALPAVSGTAAASPETDTNDRRR